MTDYPVSLMVHYPKNRQRLSILLFLFRVIICLPHYLFCPLWGACVAILFPVMLLVTLIVGRFPRWIFEFIVSYMNYYVRVWAYLWLLSDRYPPFSGAGATEFEGAAPAA